MKSKLIDKMVMITDKESMYYNEWGIVKAFDGDDYHIAIANGTDNLMIFKRQDFKVSRNPYYKIDDTGTAIH
jgi:hypothetical protein